MYISLFNEMLYRGRKIIPKRETIELYGKDINNLQDIYGNLYTRTKEIYNSSFVVLKK